MYSKNFCSVLARLDKYFSQGTPKPVLFCFSLPQGVSFLDEMCVNMCGNLYLFIQSLTAIYHLNSAVPELKERINAWMREKQGGRPL